MSRYRLFMVGEDIRSAYQKITKDYNIFIDKYALHRYHFKNDFKEEHQWYRDMLKKEYMSLLNRYSHEHTKFPIYCEETARVMREYINHSNYTHYIIMDIKNLKAVNEIEGVKKCIHGDKYLELVGNIIRNKFRKDDIVASHIGGDEILILVKMDDKGKRLNAESILHERIEEINNEVVLAMEMYFERMGIKYDKSLDLGIHYSIGKLENTTYEELRNKPIGGKNETCSQIYREKISSTA